MVVRGCVTGKRVVVNQQQTLETKLGINFVFVQTDKDLSWTQVNVCLVEQRRGVRVLLLCKLETNKCDLGSVHK